MSIMRLSFIYCALLLVPSVLFGQDSLINSISTSDGAVARAMLYTGFDKQKVLAKSVLSVTTTLTVIEDDFTPFLSDSIIGKSVWKVVVEGVKLDFPSLRGLTQQPTRTFEILIDSATGRCFGAYSYFDGHDPDMAPEPPSDTATTMLRGTTEIWHGFPTSPPHITLAQAIDKAVGSNPVQAKEIYATCVMWSHLGKPAKPVWSIIGRGIPPFGWGRGQALRPLYTRNRMRTVVDATTGDPIYVDNLPRVMMRPGD